MAANKIAAALIPNERLQALSWKKQHNLVYSNVNAGPLSYGEEDGERELIPEDGDE